jgi:hypothetical protein
MISLFIQRNWLSWMKHWQLESNPDPTCNTILPAYQHALWFFQNAFKAITHKRLLPISSSKPSRDNVFLFECLEADTVNSDCPAWKFIFFQWVAITLCWSQDNKFSHCEWYCLSKRLEMTRSGRRTPTQGSHNICS